MLRCIVVSLLVLLASCQQVERKPQMADNSLILPADKGQAEADTGTPASITSPDTILYNAQVDSIIHVAIPKGEYHVSVKGHLNKEGGPVICFIEATANENLSAGIVPENRNANIRFSHIYMPDGKSEGPYGTTIKYRLSQKGMYKLYIAPNQMAGDKRKPTDFLLTVKLK